MAMPKKQLEAYKKLAELTLEMKAKVDETAAAQATINVNVHRLGDVYKSLHDHLAPKR